MMPSKRSSTAVSRHEKQKLVTKDSLSRGRYVFESEVLAGNYGLTGTEFITGSLIPRINIIHTHQQMAKSDRDGTSYDGYGGDKLLLGYNKQAAYCYARLSDATVRDELKRRFNLSEYPDVLGNSVGLISGAFVLSWLRTQNKYLPKEVDNQLASLVTDSYQIGNKFYVPYKITQIDIHQELSSVVVDVTLQEATLSKQEDIQYSNNGATSVNNYAVNTVTYTNHTERVTFPSTNAYALYHRVIYTEANSDVAKIALLPYSEFPTRYYTPYYPSAWLSRTVEFASAAIRDSQSRYPNIKQDTLKSNSTNTEIQQKITTQQNLINVKIREIDSLTTRIHELEKLIRDYHTGKLAAEAATKHIQAEINHAKAAIHLVGALNKASMDAALNLAKAGIHATENQFNQAKEAASNLLFGHGLGAFTSQTLGISELRRIGALQSFLRVDLAAVKLELKSIVHFRRANPPRFHRIRPLPPMQGRRFHLHIHRPHWTHHIPGLDHIIDVTTGLPKIPVPVIIYSNNQPISRATNPLKSIGELTRLGKSLITGGTQSAWFPYRFHIDWAGIKRYVQNAVLGEKGVRDAQAALTAAQSFGKSVEDYIHKLEQYLSQTYHNLAPYLDPRHPYDWIHELSKKIDERYSKQEELAELYGALGALLGRLEYTHAGNPSYSRYGKFAFDFNFEQEGRFYQTQTFLSRNFPYRQSRESSKQLRLIHQRPRAFSDSVRLNLDITAKQMSTRQHTSGHMVGNQMDYGIFVAKGMSYTETRYLFEFLKLASHHCTDGIGIKAPIQIGGNNWFICDNGLYQYYPQIRNGQSAGIKLSWKYIRTVATVSSGTPVGKLDYAFTDKGRNGHISYQVSKNKNITIYFNELKCEHIGGTNGDSDNQSDVFIPLIHDIANQIPPIELCQINRDVLAMTNTTYTISERQWWEEHIGIIKIIAYIVAVVIIIFTWGTASAPVAAAIAMMETMVITMVVSIILEPIIVAVLEEIMQHLSPSAAAVLAAVIEVVGAVVSIIYPAASIAVNLMVKADRKAIAEDTQRRIDDLTAEAQGSIDTAQALIDEIDDKKGEAKFGQAWEIYSPKQLLKAQSELDKYMAAESPDAFFQRTLNPYDALYAKVDPVNGYFDTSLNIVL